MKQIIVTTSWDDGHVLDLKLATLLKKYNLKGTFYVCPKHHEFEKENLLNDEQIKTLSQDFEIGAHTMNHPDLEKISLEESEKEISESRIYLENILKKPVTSFCYPSGYYNKSHIEQIKKAGFSLARTTKRYCFEAYQNKFELPTSIHTYNHWLDIFHIALFVRFNPYSFIRLFRHWDLLAMAMFDKIAKDSGVFHLWGHAIDLENQQSWDKLENVFKHISGHNNVSYIFNKDLS